LHFAPTWCAEKVAGWSEEKEKEQEEGEGKREITMIKSNIC
jgi:hypothetical protein